MELFTYKAKCVKVVDGDTLDLDVDLGFHITIQHRFRLSGINTPEIFSTKKDSQEYIDGMKAKARVEELVNGKDLTIKTTKNNIDKYGRYLAEIFVDTLSVNETLLQEGLAKKYSE